MDSVEFLIRSSNEIKLPRSFPHHIYEVLKKEAGLSPRPLSVIKESLGNGLFLVCVDRLGNPIGWVEYFYLAGNWWGIFSLYVGPQYRRRGIGRKLIEASLSGCKNYKNYTASLHPFVTREFEKMGFKKTRLWDYPPSLLLNLLFKRFLNFECITNLPKLLGKRFQYLVYRPPSEL